MRTSPSYATYSGAIGCVGICAIEVKRDSRDGIVRLIEANPRFSGTGDVARYTVWTSAG
jgi:predicted ATP-grasp superfamily ATP-dependent carboligase